MEFRNQGGIYMWIFTRVTVNNPFSKDFEELLEKRADVQEKDTEDGLTYEESMKKIEERIKELGILEEEE